MGKSDYNIMGRSFEQQLGQYFKEENIEIKNDTIEDILVRKANANQTNRKNKINSKFKKQRKDRNKRSKASRRKNRKS